jgi:uncharacterized protein (TIGR02266 family)
MGRKKRKQKAAAGNGAKSQKGTAPPSKPQAAAKEASQAKVAPEEVVAAIVQSIAPPLFEEAQDAQKTEQAAMTDQAVKFVDAFRESGEAEALEAFEDAPPTLQEPGISRDARDADHPPAFEDHRAYPRIALAVEIGLETDSHFFSGLSGDVSEGGVFVQTYRDLPLGSEVEIEFALPTGRISTHGTVRWHRDNSDTAPPGLGIKFEDLADDARSLIHEFCEARAPLYYEVEHA